LIKHFVVKDKVKNNNIYNETSIIWRDGASVSPKDFIFKKPKGATEVFIQK